MVTSFFGAPAGIRTPDTLLKRQVLCLLSYWGAGARTSHSAILTLWLGWRDSNPLYRSQSPVCYHYTTSQDDLAGNEPGICRAHLVGWDMGLEPTTPGTTIRCSTN